MASIITWEDVLFTVQNISTSEADELIGEIAKAMWRTPRVFSEIGDQFPAAAGLCLIGGHHDAETADRLERLWLQMMESERALVYKYALNTFCTQYDDCNLG